VQRDCALKLVSLMVSTCGIDSMDTGSSETHLFQMLVVRLSCIEVQMILEEQSYENVSS